jgi:hypothetical protein
MQNVTKPDDKTEDTQTLADEPVNTEMSADKSEDNGTAEGPKTRSQSQIDGMEKLANLNVELILKRYKRAVNAWRSVYNQAQMACDSKNLNKIQDLRIGLDARIQTVTQSYEDYLEMVTAVGSVNEHKSQHDLMTSQHEVMIQDLTAQIERLRQDEDRQSLSSNGSRRSKGSRRSVTSNLSSSSNAAIKAASLRAKLRHMDMEAEHILELEKAKLKLQKIRTVKELDIAEAVMEEGLNLDDNASQVSSVKIHSMTKERYVEGYLESQRRTVDFKIPDPMADNKFMEDYPASHHRFEGNHRDIPGFKLNPERPPFIPRADPSLGKSEQGQLQSENNIMSFLQSLETNRLPVPEPEIFCGDPLRYPEWKCAFSILIEGKRIPQQEKLYYLKRYLGGEAKAVVEGLFFLQSDSAYDKAKAMLERRFGDPYVVSEAFRNKIEDWPKIQGRDAQGLRKLADFLRQCDIAMTTITSLRFLNDSRENRKLLQKCPDWIVNKWARIVADYKGHLGSFPSFHDFVDFMEKEANIACDPITSMQPHKEAGNSRMKRRVGATVLATESKQEGLSHSSSKKPFCSFCKEEHFIDNCSKFLQKPLAERKLFIRQKRLCFGCLIVGHRSADCRRRRNCGVCSKPHPSALHGDVPNQGQVNEANDNGSVDQTQKPAENVQAVSHLNRGNHCQDKCSMIIPVWVSHKDNPDISVLVYAMLDNQSDVTFLLEDAYEELNLEGVEVDLCLSTMFAENRLVKSKRVEGLVVRGYRNSKEICLPPAYVRNVMPADRNHIPTPEVAKQWPHLAVLEDKLEPLKGCKVALLIGYDCPQALAPRDVLVGPYDHAPYGQLSDLGWGIVGITNPHYVQDANDSIGVSHRILALEGPPVLKDHNQIHRGRVLFSCKRSVKEMISPKAICQMFNQDFSEGASTESAPSQEDRNFLKILQEGLKITDNHYETPLPFRDQSLKLPNSRPMAMNRLDHLRTRLLKCKRLHEDYIKFMDNMLERGYAEKVPENEIAGRDGMTWYIPHHGVYQPSKPDKIRIVFDASAEYTGFSLNKQLLQGPDMINSLIGVLCRFRKEFIAFTCDIEQMFYQFRVSAMHRDYLRFLWWEEGDLNTAPVDFRMTVHLFGATSSPGCANFCLKHIAEKSSLSHPEAAEFIRRNFYVDDGITSVSTTDQAIKLLQDTRSICAKYGLHLHKFVSNAKEVLKDIPPKDCSKGNEQLQSEQGAMCIERALGIEWCVESDMLHFRITLKDRPLTRRGVLATICSLYDPLGFAAPFILLGKTVLQEICKEQGTWDAPLPEGIRERWEKWRSEIMLLGNLKVSRCFKPKSFGNIVKSELHHFSDASCIGYGQCSYLRLKDDKGNIHCSLVIGKSRVAPLKATTIPRLELAAALVSARMSCMITKELEYPQMSETFWTDSKVVLGYINNDVRRFNVFVANRVQQIRDHTSPSQWRYVASKENPADEASRGLLAKELISSMWLSGPKFLASDETPNFGDVTTSLSIDDPEVKSVVLSSQGTESTEILEFRHISSWMKLRRVIAVWLRYIGILRNIVLGSKDEIGQYKPYAVGELQLAERKIIKLVQTKVFSEELRTLAKGTPPENQLRIRGKESRRLKRKNPIYKLNPFIDEDGLLRVGGRLKHGIMAPELKYPIILPKNNQVSKLIAQHCHELVQHQGRGMTIQEIRNQGYWIIGCTSIVYNTISKCVTCRRMFRKPEVQKMADLPSDRLSTEPPFTYVGADYFGPWLIKEGRKELKRYGVMFTCMASRAIHLEVANSLTTDSFINALRRFISIRGPIRHLRSDNGTNFVGAANELKKALEEMDQEKVSGFLSEKNCDYIQFKTNTPAASHQGGVWERQIRSVRRVLTALLQQNGGQLCDESLRTFMCEAAAVVNSRPLTVDTLNDPCSTQPLSPNNLLTMKSNLVLPPPGEFGRADVYCRARWRRVQHLMNEFWNRWRKEYLQSLQIRSKWNDAQPNFKSGDIVIIKDESLPRNLWKLARVAHVYQGSDGHVRSVKLTLAQNSLDNCGRRTQPVMYLDRPIHKLVLLLRPDDDGTPVGEP